MNIEKIGSPLPKLTINEQLVLQKWVYQMRIFITEGLQFRRATKRDDVIGPENINQSLGIFGVIRKYNRIVPSSSKRIGQFDSTADRIAIC
ncbi:MULTISPECIES: hypothetical protein [unclassified Bradyrhizobium]|uniref:hypothetical protein n=1 Tax=unclassified Bradyrhizobium TaxID=2631580 RepID=UPI00102ED137|nr:MULTISPECIES: hypothetical protein [unclassified Bradyrhizobium]MDI4237503.1 hypothetical protein [Bradyrhizobium sp. Arg237L]TAI64738.1 hypothetical protein CWO89_17250 [Bradyrhizobium sp. Leo170]